LLPALPRPCVEVRSVPYCLRTATKPHSGVSRYLAVERLQIAISLRPSSESPPDPVRWELASQPPVRGLFTELSRAVLDSEYATFGRLESAHIAATETPFSEKTWWVVWVRCGAPDYVAGLSSAGQNQGMKRTLLLALALIAAGCVEREQSETLFEGSEQVTPSVSCAGIDTTWGDPLESGYARHSGKALEKLLVLMQQGDVYRSCGRVLLILSG